MYEMKIAVQLYSVRRFLETPEQVRPTLKRLADMGYKYVEMCNTGVLTPRDFKKYLDEAGLTAVSIHTPMERLDKSFEAEMELLKIMGITELVIPFNPDRVFTDVRKYLDRLTAYKEKLEKYGVHMQYHNHAIEFVKVDGKLVIDSICECSEKVGFSIQPDVYWVHQGGVNATDFLKALKVPTRSVHFRDTLGHDGNHAVNVGIGEGNMDWPWIMAMCRRNKTEYIIVELEIEEGEEVFDQLELSIKNIKAMQD